jgi:hypothetical protein
MVGVVGEDVLVSIQPRDLGRFPESRADISHPLQYDDLMTLHAFVDAFSRRQRENIASTEMLYILPDNGPLQTCITDLVTCINSR